MTAVVAGADPAVLGSEVAVAYAEFCGSYRRLLVAIADHDRCEAYKAVGLRKEETWLCRSFDLLWLTARDWVRGARTVGAHPELGDRLASGTWSVDAFHKMAEVAALESPESVKPKGPFDDDRPVDPVPDPDPSPDPSDAPDPSPDSEPEPDPEGDTVTLTLEDLLRLMEEHSAAQLAARAAAARAEAARKRERYRTRHVGVIRFDGEGRLSIRNGELYDDDAAIVWAAFEDYANRVGKNPATGEYDPRGMRYADALRAMADAYLSRREREVGHPLVYFHADARVLSDDPDVWAMVGADHSPLGADVIRRLACFSKINLMLDDPDGNPLFLGRTQRLASWQQEAAIIYRDGACRTCGGTVGLDIHHIDEWTAEFGLTDVDRMMAECKTCHHLIHDHGWRVEGDPNREVRLIDPNGAIRGGTRPHPRFEARPRPPREWLTNPPLEVDDCAPARPEPDRPPDALW